MAGRGCRRNVPSTCNCSDSDGDGPFDAAATSERGTIAGAMDGITEWMMPMFGELGGDEGAGERVSY